MFTSSNSKPSGCPRHQHPEKTEGSFHITATNGAPVDSLTASQTVGPRGPMLLQDFTYLDHMSAFDRERIPERVVHAKGGGAFGFFEVTNAKEIKKYCKAKMFEENGKKTPMAARFSTVGGESGSADTVRDPRGFALKFYTEEGNWDLVANNTPIFFIRDPILFPSFIHTQKRNPQTHLKDANAFWDFMGLRPESVHQYSFLFSDRGTPDGFRHMHGFGSHTFKTVNEKGEAYYVKWHFKTDQGIKNLPIEKANELAGSDPDYAIRDLFHAIANGNPPSWTLFIQVMTFQQAEECSFNPFDVTKIWPHGDYPMTEIGKFTLDRNPLNYFAEIEQIAFSPAHMVPGIEASPDKMLQGRLFSYTDTHVHRLGVNFMQIPVNCPYATRNGVHNYIQDGFMRVDGNQNNAPNYFPNSQGGPQPVVEKMWHNQAFTGDVQRYETGDEDNFSQCATFFNKVLNDEERDRLCENIAGHMKNAKEDIQNRAIANFGQVDAKYGQMIREKLDKANADRNAGKQ